MEKIENNWENIQNSIEQTVYLVSKFGFTQNNITSFGALLPIALYISKTNKKNYHLSTNVSDAKNQNIIQKWLILSLVNGSFGSSSDSILKKVRDSIIENSIYEEFPYQALNKSLEQEASFSDIQIENILNINYKTKYSYLVLSLLYPDRDWNDNSYHEDHIFPKSEFTQSKLQKKCYSNEKINEYLKYFNTVLNLQLLTSSENLLKSSTPFDIWLSQRDEKFKKRHSIPLLSDYSFNNFICFIDERKKIFYEKLKSIVIL